MEAYCHLRPVNHLVGNARIIWVDIKSDICQNFGTLAVVDSDGNHCSIEGVLETQHKCFYPLPVPSYVGNLRW